MSNLRYSARVLIKNPAFTVTALATVAICLGANLAIFAVINSIMLRPLPFPNSDRLVTIYNTYPKAGVENDGSSITNYYERRGNIPAFESLSMFMERAETVGDPGAMQQEEIVRISPEFFTTLGVSLAIGRNFTDKETDPHANVIILTASGGSVSMPIQTFWVVKPASMVFQERSLASCLQVFVFSRPRRAFFFR
jgi:MacB-like periplasmic core domain